MDTAQAQLISTLTEVQNILANTSPIVSQIRLNFSEQYNQSQNTGTSFVKPIENLTSAIVKSLMPLSGSQINLNSSTPQTNFISTDFDQTFTNLIFLSFNYIASSDNIDITFLAIFMPILRFYILCKNPQISVENDFDLSFTDFFEPFYSYFTKYTTNGLFSSFLNILQSFNNFLKNDKYIHASNTLSLLIESLSDQTFSSSSLNEIKNILWSLKTELILPFSEMSKSETTKQKCQEFKKALKDISSVISRNIMLENIQKTTKIINDIIQKMPFTIRIHTLNLNHNQNTSNKTDVSENINSLINTLFNKCTRIILENKDFNEFHDEMKELFLFSSKEENDTITEPLFDAKYDLLKRLSSKAEGYLSSLINQTDSESNKYKQYLSFLQTTIDQPNNNTEHHLGQFLSIEFKQIYNDFYSISKTTPLTKTIKNLLNLIFQIRLLTHFSTKYDQVLENYELILTVFLSFILNRNENLSHNQEDEDNQINSDLYQIILDNINISFDFLIEIPTLLKNNLEYLSRETQIFLNQKNNDKSNEESLDESSEPKKTKKKHAKTFTRIALADSIASQQKKEEIYLNSINLLNIIATILKFFDAHKSFINLLLEKLGKEESTLTVIQSNPEKINQGLVKLSKTLITLLFSFTKSTEIKRHINIDHSFIQKWILTLSLNLQGNCNIDSIESFLTSIPFIDLSFDLQNAISKCNGLIAIIRESNVNQEIIQLAEEIRSIFYDYLINDSTNYNLQSFEEKSSKFLHLISSVKKEEYKDIYNLWSSCDSFISYYSIISRFNQQVHELIQHLSLSNLSEQRKSFYLTLRKEIETNSSNFPLIQDQEKEKQETQDDHDNTQDGQDELIKQDMLSIKPHEIEEIFDVPPVFIGIKTNNQNGEYKAKYSIHSFYIRNLLISIQNSIQILLDSSETNKSFISDRDHEVIHEIADFNFTEEKQTFYFNLNFEKIIYFMSLLERLHFSYDMLFPTANSFMRTLAIFSASPETIAKPGGILTFLKSLNKLTIKSNEGLRLQDRTVILDFTTSFSILSEKITPNMFPREIFLEYLNLKNLASLTNEMLSLEFIYTILESDIILDHMRDIIDFQAKNSKSTSENSLTLSYNDIQDIESGIEEIIHFNQQLKQSNPQSVLQEISSLSNELCSKSKEALLKATGFKKTTKHIKQKKHKEETENKNSEITDDKNNEEDTNKENEYSETEETTYQLDSESGYINIDDQLKQFNEKSYDLMEQYSEQVSIYTDMIQQITPIPSVTAKDYIQYDRMQVLSSMEAIECENLKHNIEQLKKDIADLEESLNKYKEEKNPQAEAIQKILNQITKQKEKMPDDREELLQQFEKISAENEQLLDEFTKLQRRNMSHEEQLDMLLLKSDEFRQPALSGQEENDAIRNQIKSTQHRISTLMRIKQKTENGTPESSSNIKSFLKQNRELTFDSTKINQQSQKKFIETTMNTANNKMEERAKLIQKKEELLNKIKA